MDSHPGMQSRANQCSLQRCLSSLDHRGSARVAEAAKEAVMEVTVAAGRMEAAKEEAVKVMAVEVKAAVSRAVEVTAAALRVMVDWVAAAMERAMLGEAMAVEAVEEGTEAVGSVVAREEATAESSAAVKAKVGAEALAAAVDLQAVPAVDHKQVASPRRRLGMSEGAERCEMVYRPAQIHSCSWCHTTDYMPKRRST